MSSETPVAPTTTEPEAVQVEQEPDQAGQAESSSTEKPADRDEQMAQAAKFVAEGKKAIALKSWEEGVAKYADALLIMRGLVGEQDPAMAPLLLSYGKGLYELAFSQAGVMGKEEVAKEAEPALEAEASGSGGLVESSEFEQEQEGDDANEEDEGGDAEQEQEGDAEANAQGRGSAGGEDEEEPPEDDYAAAWEVLETARNIYSEMVKEKPEGEMRDERLCLADCYVSLGDISTETENFAQAVPDYTAALEIKSALLPASSRQLASVHFQLANVLEFTPNRRADALKHVQLALDSFQALKSELQGLSDPSDEVKAMSEKDKEAEMADVKALVEDLEAKIEELKAAPPAEDLVSESINHLLGQPSASGSGSNGQAAETGPVNDLTSMVKKKKKPVQQAQPVAAASVAVDAAVDKGKAALETASDLAASAAAKIADTAQKVAVSVEGGVAQVAEEIGAETNGTKRKAEDAADEAEGKKLKAE